MLIKSPAGEFPITIERFEVEGSELVIVGKMGVWDAVGSSSALPPSGASDEDKDGSLDERCIIRGERR